MSNLSDEGSARGNFIHGTIGLWLSSPVRCLSGCCSGGGMHLKELGSVC